RGQKIVEADFFQKGVEARPLQKSRRLERPTHAARVGCDFEEQKLLEPTELDPLRAKLRHVDAERLDQLAVLHARGARRFAGPAIEAQLEMADDFVVERNATVGDGAHEVNA